MFVSILEILPVDDQRREVVSCSGLITYWSSGLPVQILKIQIPGPTVDLPNKKWGAVRGLGELEVMLYSTCLSTLIFQSFPLCFVSKRLIRTNNITERPCLPASRCVQQRGP